MSLEKDINEANNYIKDQKYNEAKNILIKYINQEPNNSIYWNFMGLIFRNESKLNEAYDCFIKAINTQPTTVSAYYNLGRLEGECLSFHRREDLRSLHKLNNTETVYSCFSEQNVIKTLINEIGENNLKKYCVDIGASDGLTFSNSYPLFNNNWEGFCIECDSEKFVDLVKLHEKFNTKLMNAFATPDNILDIFKIHNVPQNFGFLSLDIDSYDYYVLKEILKKYKPDIICAEINEYIPPPICLALKYTDKITGMVGQSISMLNALLLENDYSLVHLEYNNAFAIHNSKLSLLKSYKKITPEEAFKNGLTNRVDWKLKMPWHSTQRQIIYQINDKAKLLEHIKIYILHNKLENYEFYLDNLDNKLDNLNSINLTLPTNIKV